MSEAVPRPVNFRVLKRLDPDEPPIPAGVVAIDDQCRMTVISAEPRFAKFLDSTANELNRLDELQVRRPPRVEENRFGLYGQVVPRDAANAFSALSDMLGRYGVTIEPA